MKWAAGTAGVIFVLDQASKYTVVEWMDLKNRLAIDVWPPFVNFRMAWNQGINFGLFAGESDVTRFALIALAFAITGWVWIWVRRERGGRAMQIAAGVLIGGALGNVVDRIVYGAVADFLNMSCCGWSNPFAFNVADIAVFAGAAGLVLFSGGKPPKAQ